MREIKFRAYDKNKNVMIYDSSQEVAELYGLLPGDYIPKIVRIIGEEFKTYMQYTGFKDKNGNEIYECDIIKYREIEFHVCWDKRQGRYLGNSHDGIIYPEEFDRCEILMENLTRPEQGTLKKTCEWMDINTNPPRSHRPILIWSDGVVYTSCYWHEKDGKIYWLITCPGVQCSAYIQNVTHWKEIGMPPKL